MSDQLVGKKFELPDAIYISSIGVASCEDCAFKGFIGCDLHVYTRSTGVMRDMHKLCLGNQIIFIKEE